MLAKLTLMKPLVVAGAVAAAIAAAPAAAADFSIAGPASTGPATHVVSLAGCSSLRLCAEWNLGAGAVRLLMGGGPDDVPERYAVADPAALPAPAIPVTLVHGVQDDTVPLRMSLAPDGAGGPG